MDKDNNIEENLLSDINPKLDNWLNRKVHAKSHAAAHADFLKQWKADRDKKLYGGDRLALAADVGRKYRHVEGRTLIAYHQDKVAKGELPPHMSIGRQSAAMKKKVLQIAKTAHKSGPVLGTTRHTQYVPEAASPLQRLKDWDKGRVGPKIFKDKEGKTTWHKMSHPELKTIMHVPDHEKKKYERDGWSVNEGGLWDNIHKKRERIKRGSGELSLIHI